MNSPQRGGFARGQKPARPGDLAAKTAEKQRREAEAANKARADAADVEQIRRDATAKAIDATWDRAYAAGYAAAVEDFASAGIDTAAVLSLVANDVEDEVSA